jgi:hypothetical protein
MSLAVIAILIAFGAFVALMLVGIGCAFVLSGRDAEREERRREKICVEHRLDIEPVLGKLEQANKAIMVEVHRISTKTPEIVPMVGEAPPAVVYGRPQHIPEEVKARLRERWDEATAVEECDDPLRGVPG